VRFLGIVVALFGCGSVEDTSGALEYRCDEAILADGSAGRAFMLNYCTSCHNSHLAEGERYSAPVGVDFDTVGSVRSQIESVYARVADQSMPPSGGISQSVIGDFLAWLDCGAPSDNREMPFGEKGASGDAFELRVVVESAQTGLDLVRYIDSGTRGVFPDYPWSITNVIATDTEVHFLSEELFREDGTTLWSVHFQGGLAIADESFEAISDSVTATVFESGETSVEDWAVVSNFSDGEPIDGQAIGQSPIVLGVDVENGPLWEWHIYEDSSPVGYSFSLNEESGWRSIRITNESSSYPGVLPLSAGQSWVERAVVTGGISQ
jgi:hypothetical protein